MSRYYEPVIWHQMGTKGHSVYHPRTFAMPVRRHGPVVAAPRYSNYSNVRHDYAIDDSIHRADYLSNAVLEDTYEAATRSRGKDNELLRSVNAAIRPSSSSRDSTPTRISRPTKRLQSLPPVDIKPVSAVVPYRNAEKIRSALASSPPPTSLLSSRIDSYLRGSSLPPRPFPRDIASNISYTSYLPRSSSPSNIRSLVPYTSALSDSGRDYSPSYRSTSPYISRAEASSDYDYAGSDDEDYEPESYRRKYRIIRSPVSSSYHRAGSPDGSEDEYYDASDSFGTYSCPRPSGISPLKLSSYDGEYDGSYEADMAEMYDYVPFGPSRHGILELTHEDDSPLPSYTSSLPRLSPPQSSLPRVTVLPSYSRSSDVALPSPSTHPLLDSLVSSTAAKARAVLANSKLPEYKNASLVLSVEGSAVSEDGQNRYGFRYYPPPIPLRGSHIGLDERILSIAPKDVSPADSFLSKYLNRLRDIRTDIRDHVNRGDYARGHSVATVSSPSPYVHRTVTMPVHISGRAHSVPVSSYRSRLDGGQHHHVDVFPLVVSETSLPSDKKLHLPVYRAGGDSGSPTKLTVLEKINIKAAIIGSRMEADGPKRQRRPRSEFAANKLRELKRDELEEGIYYRTPSTGALHASRPPLPKPTDRKAIRDVDGFTKPKNLLSWQYRVESRLSPDDIIYEPSSFIRMRERVKDVQEKMDRQRQLLDRYLDSDFKIAPNPSQNSEGRSSAGGDPDNRPVSDLRRRIRRTLAKSKNNPDYFRD
ncbi:uncharacterized protein LOC131935367 isoform X3 [Physella acuta]|uniref:uncharacterized protein LOC131935367 isoform X3 n=1 Tax=Physella acuta TaxID=109671 RepID=UPI0027DE3956|nr:uncharacterized protein LOC131935367 isoform X3 [Physella acuta]